LLTSSTVTSGEKGGGREMAIAVAITGDATGIHKQESRHSFFARDNKKPFLGAIGNHKTQCKILSGFYAALPFCLLFFFFHLTSFRFIFRLIEAF
jgi:hypothetical protein